MQVSHSRVDTYNRCPQKYRMHYIDELKTIDDMEADNPLYLGTAVHKGLEISVEEGVRSYISHYPILTDEMITEIMKLRHIIPEAKAMLPDEGEFEVEIKDDDYVGYIDMLSPAPGFHDKGMPDIYDLYDFKYSNNIESYMTSDQLHLYKYFFEKNNRDKKIRKMYFLFIPKVRKKQERDESLMDYRRRVMDELYKKRPQLIEVTYDPDKVIQFMTETKHMLECSEFRKNRTWLCRFCEYEKLCKKGENYMILPKNERRNIEKVTKKVIWIYGAPFSGKTFFANKFPDPLMLNTDGNIKFVDAPYIPIRDEIMMNGRMTNRKFAWQVFKDVISELEKKDNTFRTIVVDLLEDTYEHCRLYMYDQMGITHESDDSFRAWDKVTTEFLSTLRRLMNLDYENIILISHEDTTKDITKRSGDKITAIKPNIREKIAYKVAGMVDIVARVVSEDGKYTLSFKADEVTFGGGRLNVTKREIPLEYEDFVKVYDEANGNVAHHDNASDGPKEATKAEEPKKEPIMFDENRKLNDVETVKKETKPATVKDDEPAARPQRKTRRRRGEVDG